MLGIHDVGRATLFLYNTADEIDVIRRREKITAGIVVKQHLHGHKIEGGYLEFIPLDLDGRFTVYRQPLAYEVSASKTFLEQWLDSTREGEKEMTFGTSGIVQRATLRLWRPEDDLATILERNFLGEQFSKKQPI